MEDSDHSSSESESVIDELFVENIEKVRERKGIKEWFVHWCDGTKTWEPREHLIDTDGTVNIELIKFDIREDNRREKEDEAKRAKTNHTPSKK